SRLATTLGLHARPRPRRRRCPMSPVSKAARLRPSRLARGLVLAGALLASAGTLAQDLLIRNATVHTATERGTLRSADVLVRNGRIHAVGSGLDAGGAAVVEAEGRPL